MFSNPLLPMVGVGALIGIVALFFVFRRVLPPTNFQERKDFIELYTKVIGSLVLIVSLLFTWQSTENTLKVSTAALKQAQEKDLKEQEKELAERFLKANEQLASENIFTRTGGIYLLGQIANDSDAYYWRSMQALTDFVRGRAPASAAGQPVTQCPVDIQAAMNVLVWRQQHYLKDEQQRLELHEIDLRKVILKDKETPDGKALEGAHLEGVQLWKANLQGAQLRGAQLQGAILTGTDLAGADLYRADLTGADLKDADLDRTDLQATKGLRVEDIILSRNFHKAKLPLEIRKALQEQE